MLNNNMEIIDQKNYFIYCTGQGKDIPLSYCDSEVKHIYSGTHDNGASENVIAIIVYRG